MSEKAVKKYLNLKPESIEGYPFGPDVAVFKVRNKMFASFSYDGDTARMNLKCDPDQAQSLRDIFDAVIPGYHMNKKHWNTVILDGSIPKGEVERMIDHSFALVVKGLKKSERLSLEAKHGKTVLYL